MDIHVTIFRVEVLEAHNVHADMGFASVTNRPKFETREKWLTGFIGRIDKKKKCWNVRSQGSSQPGVSWLWEHLFSLVKAFWKLGFNCTWLVSIEAFYSDWFLIGLSRGSFTLIGYSMFATGFEFHLIGQPESKSGLSWNSEVLNEIQEKVVKMLLLKWMVHDSHAAVAVQQMLDNLSCDFKRWNVPFNMLNRARC